MSAIALGVGVVGAASSAYGASQTPSLGAGARRGARLAAQGTYQGYRGAAPGYLAMNQQYQPQYLSLGASNLEDLFFGNAGGTMSYDRYSSKGKFQGTSSYNQPSSRGLLDILGQATPQLQGIYNESANLGRESDYAALRKYLPQTRDLYRQANPEVAALQDQISGDASQQLALGDQIDPNTGYRITQGVRGDWANRGLGGSLPAGLAESLQLYGGGQQLRQQRQGYALSSLDRLAATSPDYTSFILNQRGAAPSAMSFLTQQQPLAYQGNMFDPNQQQSAIAGMRYGAESGMANQANYAALGAGALKLSGSLMRYNQNQQQRKEL